MLRGTHGTFKATSSLTNVSFWCFGRRYLISSPCPVKLPSKPRKESYIRSCSESYCCSKTLLSLKDPARSLTSVCNLLQTCELRQPR